MVQALYDMETELESIEYYSYATGEDNFTDPWSGFLSETIGYCSYPTRQDNLTDPWSGSLSETTAVSGYRVRTREWSGTTPEP